MSTPARYETFEVEAGGGAAGLLTPGRILKALARGAGIPSEDIGTIEAGKLGTVYVEIATTRALQLATPRFLPTEEGGKPALFVLRRSDDLVDEGRAELLISSDEGALPGPGEAAIALADVLGIGQEELGFGLQGAGFLRVSVPLGSLTGPVPATVGIAGRRFKLENLAKKS